METTTTKLTNYRTLTNEQIRELRDTYESSGFYAAIDDCDRALAGSDAARRRCASAIRNNELRAIREADRR